MENRNSEEVEKIKDIEGLGLHMILSRYSVSELEYLFKKYRPSNYELIKSALDFKKFEVKYKSIEESELLCPVIKLFDDSFSEDRENQFEFQSQRIDRTGPWANWKLAIQRMAVASEIAFEKICKKNNLEFKNINEGGNYYAAIDALVDGTSIDVKAKCRIGGKSRKLELSRKRVDKGEVIALFYTQKDSSEHPKSTCRLLGILDQNLLERENLHVNEGAFFNPCLLIPFKYYFQTNKAKEEKKVVKYPILYKEVYQYFVKSEEEALLFPRNKLIKYFGIDQVISFKQGGGKSEDAIYRCHEVGKLVEALDQHNDILSCIRAYKWLVDCIIQKKTFDVHQFKEFILKEYPFTLEQKEYFKSLLRLVNFLPHYKCKFSGKSYWDSELIYYDNGVITARVEGGRENTLFAYSWYNGATISIADPEVRVCDDPSCACLTHVVSGKNRLFGKKTCPKNGQYVKKVGQAA